MRQEEKTLRLTRVFYGSLLRKMFQSIAACGPWFDRRTSTVREAPFGRFLDALQHSRKLEAERIFRQYRHLIDNSWHRFASRSDI